MESSDYKIGSVLGSGSFGCVRESEPVNGGRKIAVKIIKSFVTGPPDVLEASIMRTYSHPSLNNSLGISTDARYMFIGQQLGVGDLAKITYKSPVSGPVLKEWTNALCQAVLCLHNENIIHCDIKASNAIKYEDSTVKLSDFTFATLVLQSEQSFTHTVCTATHRPPECFRGDPWNMKLDIWSLGCTLYEIATGGLLFPRQGKQGKKDSLQHKIDSDKQYSCIVNWSRERRDPGCTVQPPRDDFVPAVTSPQFEQQPEDFKSLVLWMLKFAPTERPSIKQVMRHRYLSDVKIWSYTVYSTPCFKIGKSEISTIERTIAFCNVSPMVSQKAIELYSRCIGSMKNKGISLAMGCVWIASKIVNGVPPQKHMIQIHQILVVEKEICEHLSYTLHRSSPSNELLVVPSISDAYIRQV